MGSGKKKDEREWSLIDRGKGEWLILKYLPVSLFSLRMTHATSKGGKTLLVPTPYAFKMTLLDSCFRAFGGEKAETKARQVFDWIKGMEIRFNPPGNCVVQNTFIKIRQEERNAPNGFYSSTIAYREFCFFNGGSLEVALGIKGLPVDAVSQLKRLGRHINCIGKRGSFWQYIGDECFEGELSSEYTLPHEEIAFSTTRLRWTQYLDDFGEALCKAKDGFDRVSTYGTGRIKLGEHRILTQTLLPYAFASASKNFSRYRKVSKT